MSILKTLFLMFNFSCLLTWTSATFVIFIYFQFHWFHTKEEKEFMIIKITERKRKKKCLEKIKVFFSEREIERSKVWQHRIQEAEPSSKSNFLCSVPEIKLLDDKISLSKNLPNCVTFLNSDQKLLGAADIDFERKQNEMMLLWVWK